MHLGGLGSTASSPAGSGAEPQTKSNLVHFSFKMTSGGNNFNDFPENQLTKFQLGGKNVTILHYFNTTCPQPKNGTFSISGRPRPGHGTMRPRYGTSREIRDGWQP